MQLTKGLNHGHSTPLLSWHLVRTKPASEETALINLERQGYGVYFPRVRHKVLRRGKWRDRIMALFPRYLFVSSNATQSLAHVRSTVGVASVVRFGVDYLAVPTNVIELLRRGADPESGLHSLRVTEWFRCGDTVRITRGSLAGLEGIFESEDGHHRVSVLLDLLGRNVSIQIDAGCVVRSAA